MREYARLLLPEWGFWPARERHEGEVEGIPDAPSSRWPRSAGRSRSMPPAFGLLREAVLARVPRRKTAPWVPPALEALLPEGPLELRRYDGTITDETDEGTETVSVEVDETLDPSSAGLPALMRVARSQWAALTSLCWACGLAQVALPESIQAPAGFAAAAGAAITRFFRAQDTLATGGLRSQSAGRAGLPLGGHGHRRDAPPVRASWRWTSTSSCGRCTCGCSAPRTCRRSRAICATWADGDRRGHSFFARNSAPPASAVYVAWAKPAAA